MSDLSDAELTTRESEEAMQNLTDQAQELGLGY
jgi:uncharacterized protein YbjQ (UPF0145 family)